jgi:molybdopterin/thiamine biosynthesis adenylyltransferase/ubiquitin-protein ligase
MSNGAEQAPTPWFELDPGRQADELVHVHEIDPAAQHEVRDGQLRISTSARYKGESVPVVIDFPADYPYMPPKLFGEPGLIARHQNPIGGNFCIIDNDEHWWQPHFRAAQLLNELQRLLDADEAGEVAAGERDMPEPLSGGMAKHEGLAVLVFDDATDLDLAADRGSFVLRKRNDHQWVLTELRDGDGRLIAEIPRELSDYLQVSNSTRRSGQWVARDDPMPTRPGELNEAATEALRGMVESFRGRRPRRGGTEMWSAVTFREQGPQRGKIRRNWLFYSARVSRGSIGELRPVIPTQALSRSVRDARLTELIGLEQRRFLVVGAGAIGGQLTLELAKAGVGYIDLIDGDSYDVGNAVRHPLPLDAGGLGKALAVAKLARSFNPFCQVKAHDIYLGRTAEAAELADRLVAEADVVIDATGLHSVTRLLHHRCAAVGNLGLVRAALSVGGHGGRILALRDSSPCFDCYLLDDSIPSADAGPIDNTTPYGCSHPAASCAGFDAVEIVANAARTAIRLVPDISYPLLDFDWAVINFRPGSERWTQGQLEVQPECPWCNA